MRLRSFEIYRGEEKDHLRVKVISSSSLLPLLLRTPLPLSPPSSSPLPARLQLQDGADICRGGASYAPSFCAPHRTVLIELRDLTCDGEISWPCRLRLAKRKNPEHHGRTPCIWKWIPVFQGRAINLSC
jgi:hypothetical protein